MVTGVNHITISVRDLARSFEFYKTTLGFKPRARWPRGAYLFAGDLWFCLTLDDRTRSQVSPEYTHIAFSVAEENFDEFTRRLREAGVRTWKENVSEGPSFYFLDPDGHKFEIHVGDLESRLTAMRELSDPEVDFF